MRATPRIFSRKEEIEMERGGCRCVCQLPTLAPAYAAVVVVAVTDCGVVVAEKQSPPRRARQRPGADLRNDARTAAKAVHPPLLSFFPLSQCTSRLHQHPVIH